MPEKLDYQTQCLIASNLAQIVHQNIANNTDNSYLTVDNLADEHEDLFTHSLKLATYIYRITFDELISSPPAEDNRTISE